MKKSGLAIFLAAASLSQAQTTTFAAVGDFGVQTADATNVANMIHGWSPDFVLTLGDNNYNVGAASTIDINIGKYYARYMSPYSGAYGPGATTNRFFPSLGNHDWGNILNNPNGANPYLAYFNLPGNERYYDYVKGPVHFFVIDSDANEPDGISATSVQALWLKGKLKASSAPFRVVYWHHPPFSSGSHGSATILQWPLEAWGATTNWTGHEHDYERIDKAGFQYIVNGTGGQALRTFGTPIAGSVVRDSIHYGAQKVTASTASMTSEWTAVGGTVYDSYTWNSRPVTGTVTLGDFSAALPASMIFRFTKGSMVIERTGTVAPNGDFVCYGPVTDGSYSVAVKYGHWLRQSIGAVNITSAGASGLSFTLINGDVVDDNVIDLSDYTQLVIAFNAQPADPNWQATADLNGDLVVDLTDYTILVVNFNALGDA
ncbi:MAG: metallophosphoesterase [Armatimonadetes bacterium]|nr:metallophosphoesterase [Armatimonadota bacterium]